MKRRDFLRLPDGTGLNIQNIQPILGYVFSARGKKRLILSGAQSDVDFACAASALLGGIHRLAQAKSEFIPFGLVTQ